MSKREQFSNMSMVPTCLHPKINLHVDSFSCIHSSLFITHGTEEYQNLQSVFVVLLAEYNQPSTNLSKNKIK